MSGFGFEINPEEMAQHGERMAAEGGRLRGKFVSFPDGRSRWRILPPWSAAAARDKLVYKIVRKHFMRGASNNITVTKCLSQDGNDKTCPICAVVEKWTVPYDKSMSEAERKKLDNGVWRFRVTDTYNFNAIQRSIAPGSQDQLVILTAGRDFMLWYYGLFRAGLGNPLDANGGRDVNVTVTKNGQKRNRQYFPSDPCPIVPVGNELAEELTNLDLLVRLNDEDVNRAQEAAVALERLMKSRQAERKAASGAAPLDTSDLPEMPAAKMSASTAALLEAPDPAAAAVMAPAEVVAKYPRGWRIGKEDRLPRPPKIDDNTGKPVCFGDFFSKLRANDPDNPKATNDQCKLCPHELPCRQRASAAVIGTVDSAE